MMELPGLPKKQGLYDPQYEKDSCGIGFVVNIKGQPSHEIVQQGTGAPRAAIRGPVTGRGSYYRSRMHF